MRARAVTTAARMPRRTAAALLAAGAADVVAGGARAADCDLTSTPSGLQFCDLAPGDGAEAQAGTLIRCDLNLVLLRPHTAAAFVQDRVPGHLR